MEQVRWWRGYAHSQGGGTLRFSAKESFRRRQSYGARPLARRIWSLAGDWKCVILRKNKLSGGGTAMEHVRWYYRR